jgi:hypothetical protein
LGAIIIGITAALRLPAAAAVTLAFESAGGRPGERVELLARLETDEPVAGIEVELGFDPPAVIAVDDEGRPDCEEEPSIDKGATGFSFRPARCNPFERDCKAIRALVVATDNTDAIPSGSVLFRCRVQIAFDAEPGMYRFRPRRGLYSPPEGADRRLGGRDLLLLVSGPPLATATPKPPASPSPPADRGSGGGGCELHPEDALRAPRGLPPWFVISLAGVFILYTEKAHRRHNRLVRRRGATNIAFVTNQLRSGGGNES